MSFRDIAKGRLQLLALGVGCCFPFFCVPHSAQADDEVESHACPWGRQAFQCLDIQPTIPRPPWPPTAWRAWKDGASVAGERGLRGLHHMEREAGRMCLRDTSVKPKKPYFAASRPRCKCSRPERSSKNLQHELHQLQLNQSPAQASGPAVWCEGKE